jgi:Xaa-Pro aminopeptidase
MRLVKSEEEIRRIRKSTEIAEQAIGAMMGALCEGTTDRDLLRVARRAIVDSGAEGWDHLTLGIGASDPEAPDTGVSAKRGELCRFDVGAVWQGYVSDVSRQAVIGPAPKDAAAVMETLCRVQEFCVGLIRPAGSPRETYAQTGKFFKSLERRGTCHVTGHSIGLECEELHLFSPMKKMDMPFQENMVLDVEVWQSFEGAGLIGVEDCYRVTATGCERLSSLPRGIREV